MRGKVRYLRNSEKLTEDEITKVIGIIQNDKDARFYPISFNFGFYPSYVVGKDEKELLRFSDKQLPKNYNFDKLSRQFKDTKNEIKNKSSYYY